MRTPSMVRLFSAIPNSRSKLRFVGGCVRDSLMGYAVADIDLATTYLPDQILGFLQSAGIKGLTMGIEHGTVTAQIGEVHVEMTTLRKDIETFGRHARVTFTDQWQEDAVRRDFTFNALYASWDGEVFDYTGGMEDLNKGIVRFIGDPRERIQEDYLRILRYFRFYGRYGRGKPDEAAVEACLSLREGLEKLSGERIYQEFFKILSLPNFESVLSIMLQTQTLKTLFRMDHAFKAIYRLFEGEKHLNYALSPLLKFYILCSENLDHLMPAVLKMRCSNREKRYFETLLEARDVTLDFYHLYTYGPEVLSDLLIVEYAHNMGISELELQENVRLLSTLKRPIFPLKGGDLLKKGMTPGVRIGNVLAQVEAWWIRHEGKPTREECLDYAQACLL